MGIEKWEHHLFHGVPDMGAGTRRGRTVHEVFEQDGSDNEGYRISLRR